MSLTLTTCPYCGTGCQFYLMEQAGKAVGVQPSTTHPVTAGQLCVKGWNAFDFVNHPDRLRQPMIREFGRLRPASWEEALSLVATRLLDIRASAGGDALMFLSSAKATNEENFLMMRLARAVFGTNNVDHCARLCHSSTVLGLAATFGSGAMTNSIDCVEKADVIYVTGSNTTEQHPLIGTRILNAVRDGARLIVADNRRIRLSRVADLHLRHRNGTDVALLNGLMHVILRDGLADEAFIAERTENADALRDTVSRYPPDLVARITGLEASQIEAAAHMFGEADKAMIIYSMGITQHTHGVDNVKSCANLAMLTGNVGRPGTGVNPLRGQNNVQGACDMGALPNVYSGYQKVTDPDVRRKFEQAWGVDTLPGNVGLTVTTATDAAIEGRVKALYVMGENPMMSDPDQHHVRKALESLDFLVVQDIFLNQTAEYAHVILPAACYAEKSGTFTSTERRVQRVRPGILPPGEARADWDILCDLATRCGYSGMHYTDPSQIMDDIARLTPIYGGISYARIEELGLQWPCPDAAHPGTPVLHVGRFTRGKGLFAPAEYRPPAEEPDEDYPFVLSTGRSYFHFHTGTMTRRTRLLDREQPGPYVEVNEHDAARLGIVNRECVRVATRRGNVTVAAHVSDIVPPGILFMTFHFEEGCANVLTNNALDPEAKIPEYKVCAASLSKVT